MNFFTLRDRSACAALRLNGLEFEHFINVRTGGVGSRPIKAVIV